MKHPLGKALAISIVAVGLGAPIVAQTCDPSHTRLIGPKNLVSPTFRGPCVQTVLPKELTNREAKRLAARADSRADHMKLVEFYTAKADRLDAQALGYEQAAAAYRNAPRIKNLMSPSTPGQYEYFGKRLREEAKTNRALAALHEHMALIAGH